jgi:protoheme IX farnesyltransferase
VALTRPRILGLILLTVPPAAILGGGRPGAGRLAGLLGGVACLACGSSALNAWWERERDAKMRRTAERPLPTGRLLPRQALGFGLLLCAAGLVLLWRAGGPLAGGLGAATLLHYLGIYTVWLKPRSMHATLVGALAGAAPPLIADAADGRVGPWGLFLFTIVFLWQAPHVWAITLYRADEYAAAGFPTLASARGARSARRWSLAFALALLAVTLLPWLVGALGPLYALAAFAAGGGFVARIARAMRLESPAADRAVFRASLLQLAAVLAALLLEGALA